MAWGESRCLAARSSTAVALAEGGAWEAPRGEGAVVRKPGCLGLSEGWRGRSRGRSRTVLGSDVAGPRGRPDTGPEAGVWLRGSSSLIGQRRPQTKGAGAAGPWAPKWSVQWLVFYE